MRLKLDENLPVGLVGKLSELGYDIDTVETEGLVGFADDAVWEATQGAGRVLVTQDLDFSDLRRFIAGTHCGIVLVRLGNPSRRELTEHIVKLFTTDEAKRWEHCFVVATGLKVRIHRPSAS